MGAFSPTQPTLLAAAKFGDMYCIELEALPDVVGKDEATTSTTSTGKEEVKLEGK